MSKHILTSVIIFAVMAALGLLAYNYLEIYPRDKYTAPSREVSSNLYYAMEQWLIKSGRNVRIENYFVPYSLAEITERVIMINSGTYRWNSGGSSIVSTNEIIRWIEEGGCFILCIDYSYYTLNENLCEFLSDYGIMIESSGLSLTASENIPEDENSFYGADRSHSEDPFNDIKTAETSYNDSFRNDFPNFSPRIFFTVDNEENFNLITDADGKIRLVEKNIGNGTLTVTGHAVFMYNNNLSKDVNAELAWRLTGAKTDGGILFIRTQNRTAASQIFGVIFERGNLIPVFISALILVILGFWMIIPRFGLVQEDRQRASRPIKDRLDAEIGFLKKNKALDYYLDIYKREQKTDEKSEKEKTYNYREIINAIKKAQENVYGTKS